MLFEVYRDKQRLMYTEYEECIPPIEIIKSIKANGCKVFLDGKAYKVTKDSSKDDKESKKKK